MDEARYIGYFANRQPKGKYYLAKVPIRAILFPTDPDEICGRDTSGSIRRLSFGETFPSEYAKLPVLVFKNHLLYVKSEPTPINGTSNMVIDAVIAYPD